MPVCVLFAPELHRVAAAEGSMERFRQLYEALPEQRRDLSTRWNDLSQKTLLTRLGPCAELEGGRGRGGWPMQ